MKPYFYETRGKMNPHLTQATVTIHVETFRRILVHSWHLLPEEKKIELMRMGLFPDKSHSPSD